MTKGAVFTFLVLNGFVRVNSVAQTETLSTQFNQAVAQTDACGTTNVQVYGFSFNSTSFSNPSFTGLVNWTTSGTYAATDILNFKLWQTNFSVFNTTNLLATLTTGLGPGTHSFPVFSYLVSPSPVTRYFWITVDLSSSASNGSTIICNIITPAMTTINGTESNGTNTAGGTQTITCSALPVTIKSFNATLSGKKVKLDWSTEREDNNSFFTVERATDAVQFKEIAIVQDKGNHQHYEVFDDENILNDGAYYRLKQTDINGTFSYFHNIVTVLNRADEALQISMDKDLLKIITKEETSAFCIVNSTGHVCIQEALPGMKNEINISTLPPGIYFISVNTIKGSLTRKFVVQQ